MVKLMKYDLRSALRLFVPLWIGALLVSILHTVSVSLSENIPLEAVRSILSVLFVAALVIGMIAVLLLPMIYFVVRFYHSTVKDEGYLTFTLPVSVDAVIWSKVLTGAIVCICSVLVCLLMAVILMWTKLPSLSDIQPILREIIELVNGFDLVLSCHCHRSDGPPPQGAPVRGCLFRYQYGHQHRQQYFAGEHGRRCF